MRFWNLMIEQRARGERGTNNHALEDRRQDHAGAYSLLSAVWLRACARRRGRDAASIHGGDQPSVVRAGGSDPPVRIPLRGFGPEAAGSTGAAGGVGAGGGEASGRRMARAP